MGWFSRLSLRERILMVVMALLAVGAGYWSYVWQPLEQAKQAALRDISRYDRVAAEVTAAGDTLVLPGSAVRGNPATLVTDSAAEYDIAIRRLEPEAGVTRVTLAEVPFEVLIAWLSALETDYALRVTAIEMDRRPEPGVVLARVTLEE